jgi:nucleoside 2-deoxyribosyltransferase
MTTTIYLASPLGFFDAGRRHLVERLVPDLEARGLAVNEPFAVGASLVEGRQDLTMEALAGINQQMGALNARLIREADAVLAVLDGPDVDSGTASEIGYAFASGTPVVGLLTDWRSASDNAAARVNLQVEYFILASGGAIVGSLDEAVAHVQSLDDAD